MASIRFMMIGRYKGKASLGTTLEGKLFDNNSVLSLDSPCIIQPKSLSSQLLGLFFLFTTCNHAGKQVQLLSSG